MPQTNILLVLCPGTSPEFVDVFKRQVGINLKAVDLDVVGDTVRGDEMATVDMLEHAMSKKNYAGVLVSRIEAVQEGPIADELKAIRERNSNVQIEQVYCTNPKLMDFMHMRELRELLKKIPDYAYAPADHEHV